VKRICVKPGIFVLVVLFGVGAVSAAQYDTLLYNSYFTQSSDEDDPWALPKRWDIKGQVDSVTAFCDPENHVSAPYGVTIWSNLQSDSRRGFLAQGIKKTGDPEAGWGTPVAPGQEYTYSYQIKVDSVGWGRLVTVMHYSFCHYWCDTGGWQQWAQYRSPTDGWVEENGAFTVPDGAWWAILEVFFFGGPGAVSIDDININGTGEIIHPDDVVSISRYEAAYEAQMRVNTATDNGNTLRIYRPDGRAVNLTTPSGIMLDPKQVAPGCYLKVREGANGIATERMLTK